MELFTRAVIVAVPIACAVIVPSGPTEAIDGSDELHSTPDGVEIGLFSEVADTLNRPVLPAVIVSETKIVAAAGESDSDNAKGAKVFVVLSLEHALAPAIATERASSRRTNFIHDLRNKVCEAEAASGLPAIGRCGL